MNGVLNRLNKDRSLGKKSFAVLIDPDGQSISELRKVLELSQRFNVDYFLIGGSHIVDDNLTECLSQIRQSTNIPIILFPGSTFQINEAADAILFLSLISGRNPDLLIGKHVESAPRLYNSNLEIIPTGYMLIDGGTISSVQYISNTLPLPSNKPDIALSTALAGQMLGMKNLYLDAGSGARYPVPDKVISTIAQTVDLNLFVGGGIKSGETAFAKARSGANVIVVGNVFEKDPTLIQEISLAIKEAEKTIQTSATNERNRY